MSANMLSVIILTCNRLEYLRLSLRALERQNPPPDEVIVIDTGSQDGTPDWLRAYQKTAPFELRMDELLRGGFAEARNRGLKLAAGDYVAFIDDDCEAESDWTQRIHANLAECDAVGGVAIPGEYLVFPLWWHNELNWLAGLSAPGQFERNHGGRDYPSTSNLAARRAVFERIPFQPSSVKFRRGFVYEGGREDAQFWRAARRAGWITICDPRLVVQHHIGYERFKKIQVLRRAFADGRALWRRERQRRYAERALRDVLLWKVRFLENILQPDHQGWPAELAREFLWMIRQCGFLWACAWSSPRNFLHVSSESLLLTPRVLVSQLKRPARKLLVAWRRRRGLIPPLRKGPRRLLVVCFGFIGDLLLLEPVCRAYKTANPNCAMTLLTDENGEQLHRDNGVWSSICVLKNRGSGARRLPAGFKIETDAAAIPYFHRDDDALLDHLTRSAPCVTFDRDVGFELRRYYEWCAAQVRKDFCRHELDNLTALFRALGSVGRLEPAQLKFTEMELKLAREYFGHAHSAPERTVLAHFGSERPDKRWPVERWEALCKILVHELGLGVVLIGGAQHARQGDQLAMLVGGKIFNACGRTSLRYLGALIAQAALLISGDSGPKHVAFATGTPTLTLYGPSDPARWGDKWNRPLHQQLLGGCFDLTEEEMYGLPPDHLMRNITVEAVARMVREMLQLEPGG